MAKYTEDNAALKQYIASIQKFETLSFEEEQALAKDWRDHKTAASAHKLINAHLRLVVKVALGFRGYGLPVSEIIQEGNIGLMQAIVRFDPERGFRLSTYAMWWIKASIQEYILHSWSLVKIGTTAAQKKLFFNLRKMRNQIQEVQTEQLTADQVTQIAEALNVKESEVIGMSQRLTSSDQSLNSFVSDDVGSEWVDWLADDKPNQEELFSKNEIYLQRHDALKRALEELNDREREIFMRRRLKENSDTLEILSQRFGISRERVRQLEARAFAKVQKHMQASLAA